MSYDPLLSPIFFLNWWVIFLIQYTSFITVIHYSRCIIIGQGLSSFLSHSHDKPHDCQFVVCFPCHHLSSFLFAWKSLNNPFILTLTTSFIEAFSTSKVSGLFPSRSHWKSKVVIAVVTSWHDADKLLTCGGLATSEPIWHTHHTQYDTHPCTWVFVWGCEDQKAPYNHFIVMLMSEDTHMCCGSSMLQAVSMIDVMCAISDSLIWCRFECGPAERKKQLKWS